MSSTQPQPSSPGTTLLLGALFVVIMGGVALLGAPIYVGLTEDAGTRVAEKRQDEIIEIQDELKASTGSYADSITELSDALKEEGLDDTAANLAQLTASSSGWCAVLNQDRGRMSSLALTIHSDGSKPEIFKTIADAAAACED